MKNSLRFIAAMMLAAVVFYACTDDGNDAKPTEKIQFSFDLKTATNGKVKEAPAGSSLVVSLQDEAGQPVLSFARYDLLKIGDQFITAPIELAIGKYKIIDFLVVNAEDEIIYATPQKGSPLAPMVSVSLPFSFTVSKNSVKNVPVEVVSTELQSPASFGYASFNIIFKEGLPLSVNVLALVNGSYVTTSATAKIIHEGDTIATYNLKASGNIIVFDEDGTYTLIVSKPGYQTYSRTFVYSELIAEQDGSPLSITLNEGGHTPVTIDGFFQLNVNYRRDSVQVQGQQYPNAFTEGDYFGVVFQVQNDQVVNVQDIYNDFITLSPDFATLDSCTAYADDDGNGAMNLVSMSGYIIHGGSIPRVHLDFVQNNTFYPRFSMLCGTQEQYYTGGDPRTPAITSFEFDLEADNCAVYISPDGYLDIDVCWN